MEYKFQLAVTGLVPDESDDEIATRFPVGQVTRGIGRMEERGALGNHNFHNICSSRCRLEEFYNPMALLLLLL